jgi:flagellin
MISGLSSSLALAQQTASRARERMNTVERQLATGQKVSSVKDDGASWARANTLRNTAATWDWRHDELVRLQAVGDIVDIQATDGTTIMREAANLLQRAAQTQPNSKDRTDLKLEYDALLGQWAGLRAALTASDNMWTMDGGWAPTTNAPPLIDWALDITDADPFLNTFGLPNYTNYWSATFGTNLPSYTPTVSIVDGNFSAATTAQMASAGAELLNSYAGVSRVEAQAARLSGSMKAIEQGQRFAQKASDLAHNAASSLTDADLGALSTQLEQARTRQDLALGTMRAALDAYGRYATSLLGNVQAQQSLFA